MSIFKQFMPDSLYIFLDLKNWFIYYRNKRTKSSAQGRSEADAIFAEEAALSIIAPIFKRRTS